MILMDDTKSFLNWVGMGMGRLSQSHKTLGAVGKAICIPVNSASLSKEDTWMMSKVV